MKLCTHQHSISTFWLQLWQCRWITQLHDILFLTYIITCDSVDDTDGESMVNLHAMPYSMSNGVPAITILLIILPNITTKISQSVGA